MIKLKLKAKRKEKKLSQEEFAELLFMDQSQYNRRENGQIKISDDEWKRMAIILNVKIDQIFESDNTTYSNNHEHKEKDNSKATTLKIKIKINPNQVNEISNKLNQLLKLFEKKGT
ncbi:helix-turn-helix transcriptional regulator [Flavobacterium sp. ov086]|uniref:helix-turn-helix domain-containing protein n=1 Tax=Flavobacterium sp. ov086 TaxID=1761785 RepID=UPI000B6D4B0C|nr:helix-turn-helix transcriptional regulator [Flavobacterium sp. ov086]SNR29596.1 Helix-turn-helix [Flavobacterium sp. ov086]